MTVTRNNEFLKMGVWKFSALSLSHYSDSVFLCVLEFWYVISKFMIYLAHRFQQSPFTLWWIWFFMLAWILVSYLEIPYVFSLKIATKLVKDAFECPPYYNQYCYFAVTGFSSSIGLHNHKTNNKKNNLRDDSNQMHLPFYVWMKPSLQGTL